MNYIKSLVEGSAVQNGYYLVISANRGMTNKSVPYLSLSFQDKTGIIDAKKWDASDEDFTVYQQGNIVCIDAEVFNYKTGLQMKVISGRQVDPVQENIDVTEFIMSAPASKDELEEKVKKYISSIQDKDCKAIVNYFYADKRYEKIITYPAAVRNHHEYANGLIYHTLSMCDMASKVCECYKSVDYDMLISGCLLHDIGKTIELSGPIIPKYTLEGKLIGHISIMQAMIREAAEQLNIQSEVGLLLEHMILSHHGKQEFGSPVPPLTKEAMILNMVDDMDAKITMLDKALQETAPGEFTLKIFPLDDRCFYKPKER